MKKSIYYKAVRGEMLYSVAAEKTEGYIYGEIGVEKAATCWVATHAPTGTQLATESTRARALECAKLMLDYAVEKNLIAPFVESTQYKEFDESRRAQEAAQAPAAQPGGAATGGTERRAAAHNMKKTIYYNAVKGAMPYSTAAQKVEGYVYGEIGIEKGARCWIATHVPTGTRLATESTRAQALECAKLELDSAVEKNFIASFVESKQYKEFDESRRAQEAAQATAPASAPASETEAPAPEDAPAPLPDNYTITTAQGAVIAEIRTVDLHAPAPDDVSTGNIKAYTVESANARLEAARANYNGYNGYEVMAAKDAARRAKAAAEKRERAAAYLAEKFPHLAPAPAQPSETESPAPAEAPAPAETPARSHAAMLAAWRAKGTPATGSAVYHVTPAGAEPFTVTGAVEKSNGTNYTVKSAAGVIRMISAKEFTRPRRAWLTAAEYAANLRAEIERHEEAYYIKAAPEISDAAFDEKFRALQAVEAAAPETVTPQSPTQRPGGRAVVAPVEGRAPMLSMRSAESPDELEALAQIGPVCLMPKIDGCSVQLEYENGILARGYLRGDGRTGEDVTENLRAMPGIPAQISYTGPLTVRGEAHIGTADLERLQSEQPGKFKVPAAAASGTLRQGSPEVCRARGLRFLAFEMVGAPGFHAAQMLELERLGFAAIPCCVYFNFGEAQAEMERLWSRRAELPYAVDGMVLRLNDTAQFAAQGATGREAKGLIAWKFDAQRAEAEILRLEETTGATGRRTVIAHIAPALLGGKTIRKVTLGDARFARGLGLAAGDKIEIALKGGVVPVFSRAISAAHDAPLLAA